MPIDYSLFRSDDPESLEIRIAKFLNANPPVLSSQTANSTRAVGDAIQQLMSDNFATLLQDEPVTYSANFARRAMADLAFTDIYDNYYLVDVKTHRVDTAFNMPNLTSVRRICQLYEDDSNFFVILMLRYRVDGTRVIVDEVHFVPIEFLRWSCLTIGALGWGQIQIANTNRIDINRTTTRKAWMLELCDAMLEFYPREIAKINDRIDFASEVRRTWEGRED